MRWYRKREKSRSWWSISACPVVCYSYDNYKKKKKKTKEKRRDAQETVSTKTGMNQYCNCL